MNLQPGTRGSCRVVSSCDVFLTDMSIWVGNVDVNVQLTPDRDSSTSPSPAQHVGQCEMCGGLAHKTKCFILNTICGTTSTSRTARSSDIEVHQ